MKTASLQSRVALIVALIVATSAGALLSTRTADPDPNRVAGILGPTPGPNSSGHVANKRAYLERLAAQDPSKHASALVSLDTYLAATVAQSMVKDFRATAVFVRFPGSEPEVQLVRTTINGALADRASDLRNELEAEIDALDQSGSTALVAQRRVELEKIEAGCPCVYGFTVEGAEVDALQELAKRPQVRLVDVPDPVVTDLGGFELVPIVPPVPAG